MRIGTIISSAYKSSQKTPWTRTAGGSQLQAIKKLASGVHKLAQVNAKRLKVEIPRTTTNAGIS